MVVLMVIVIGPAAERPTGEHEAETRHEVTQRGQRDGDAVCNRRRKVDQSLHELAPVLLLNRAVFCGDNPGGAFLRDRFDAAVIGHGVADDHLQLRAVAAAAIDLRKQRQPR
jgi:hypothetical protein